MEYHSTPIENLLKSLDTSKKGLTTAEAGKRLQQQGLNEIAIEKKDSLVKLFLNQFKSFIVFILLVAILLAILIGEGIDAIAIAAILVLNAVLGFAQEYRSEKAIESLRKLTEAKTIVLRSGKEIKTNSSEIVTGDIIHLSEGDKVPADCRLLSLSNLEIDESSLTGESIPGSKNIALLPETAILQDRRNMVYAGTSVTRGSGAALVLSTGMKTEVGKIAGMLQKIKPELTPLQKKLDSLGKLVGVLAICAGVLILLLGYFRGGDPGALILTAIALAVAAIPEGLPAIITIALALGVQRMAKRNALVRKLPAVETLGSTTVICTDKTGTLTQNKMQVTRAYIDLEEKDADNIPHSSAILDIAVLCNNASASSGDPTEVALLHCAKKYNLTKPSLEKEFPRKDEVAFSSEQKYMATQHLVQKKKVWYVKGAVDVILEKCAAFEKYGKVVKLSQKVKSEILEANERMAKKALRVLAFAYGPLDALVFVGLLGMIDPPRKEVKEAMQKCKEAGIKVVMITGDHLLTARAIAAEIGIEGKAVSGEEIEMLNLEKEVDDIAIYARVNPEHKLRIVKALKKKGHIVAMTGDGVNDAPALKEAHIGIAMGMNGTEVAKEASDMVLADDNFASIVSAIEEGRGIYDNIKKFVLFLFTSNITEVLVLLVAALLGLPLPLIAIQILWVNLVTDGLPALALGVDPISKDIMKLKPRNPEANFLKKYGLLRIMLLSSFLTFLVMVLFSNALDKGIMMAQSIVFTALVVFEFAVAFLIRVPYQLSPFSNKYLILSVVGSFLLQLLLFYTRLSKVFKVVPLGIIEWLSIGFTLLAVIIVGYIINRFLSSRRMLHLK